MVKHRSFEAPGKCEVIRCKFRFGLDSGQARVRFRSKLQRCVKGSPSQKHLESWNIGISKERIIIYILLLLLQISILTPKVLHSNLKPHPNQIPTFPPFWNQFQPFYLTLQYTRFHLTYPHPQTELSTEIPPLAEPQEDTVTILGYNYCIICKVML